MDINSAHRRREIFKIGVPVFVELLMGTLFGMVDMIMLGNSGTGAIVTASIAAIGITNQYTFIGLSLLSALTTGATAIIARYIGAKKHDRIENVLRHILLLAMLFLAVPVIIFGLTKSDLIMGFIGAQPDAIEAGRDYFRAIMVGFIFQAFNFATFASMRGTGDTKTPMRINMVANILNVIGNAVLIFGLFGFPAMGVTGAGVSTALSQVVAAILSFIYLVKGKNVVKLTLSEPFHFDSKIIYNLVKIGIPAAIEQVLFRVGILLYVRTVADLGTTVYATHQLSLNILSLSFTIGQAFGVAASTLVGRSLGQNDTDLAENYMKDIRNIGMLLAIPVSLLLFFGSSVILRLYTQDPEIISMGSGVLKMIAFIQPFQAAQFISAGGLRGAGDTMFTLVSTGVGVLGVRNLGATIFIRMLGMGLTGAWIALIFDQMMRWVLIGYRVRTGHWKHVKLK